MIEEAPEDLKKKKKEELLEYIEQLRSQQTTIIHMDKPVRSELHPTMKPVELMAELIKNSSRKGEAVLDSFGGSGSTLMACEQLERRCYTCELNPLYIDVIIERWEKFTGKKAVKLNE